MPAISLTVNGSEVAVAADPDTPLLDVLRNHLGLVGTKFGCGLEQCGCCMVLIDGRPEKSCGKAVSTVAGKAGRHDRGARHARNDRTRCSRLFSTSRPGNAAIACRASSSRRRHCSMRTRRRAGPRSPGRSTTISAAAAAMRAFCAPSSARRRADAGGGRPMSDGPRRIAGASAAEPEARPVGRVSRSRERCGYRPVGSRSARAF